VCIKSCSNLGKGATEILAIIRQVLGEESMRGKSKLTEAEKGETGEEQSHEHIHHFL
jgi:hypothetical protein